MANGEMLHEKDIKMLLPEILYNIGGIASKQEIVDYLVDNYDLDVLLDKAKSLSRNEERFVQRVGNIVSHVRQDLKESLDYIEFPEGFAIVKTHPYPNKSEWLFALSEKDAKPFVHQKVLKPKACGLAKRPLARKYNWSGIEAKRAAVGLAGEKFVLETELEYVSKMYPTEKDRVRWISQTLGDGLGCDIISVCHDDPNKDVMIEVKSTSAASFATRFQMTSNELRVCEEAMRTGEHWELHRCYNPTANMSQFAKKILLPCDLKNNYHLVSKIYDAVLIDKANS